MDTLTLPPLPTVLRQGLAFLKKAADARAALSALSAPCAKVEIQDSPSVSRTGYRRDGRFRFGNGSDAL